MRRLRNQLPILLLEVLQGEDRADHLTRTARKCFNRRSRLSVFHADEDGKISFVTIFVVLAFFIVIGLVTNTGISVKEKIELQNAADAAVYSDALWVARSMNAVTTANHMTGEIAAMSVILDSFGGPMLGRDSGLEYKSETSGQWSDLIDQFHPEAPIKEGGYFSAFLAQIDKRIVDFAHDQVVGEGDDRDHVRSGAAIYESKMTLKFGLTFCFGSKNVANVLLEIAVALEKTPLAFVGVALEGVSIGIHAFMSKYVIEITKEWMILDAIESVIGAINKQELHDGLYRAAQAMGVYADTVVGIELGASLNQGKAPLNEAIRKTSANIKDWHRLDDVKIYPAWNKIELPVTLEPQPYVKEQQNLPAQLQARLGDWSFPETEWSGDFESGEMKTLRQPFEAVAKKVRWAMEKFDWFLGPLAEAAGAVSGFVDNVTNAVGSLFGSGGGGKSNPVLGEIKKQFSQLKTALDTIKLLESLATKGLEMPNNSGYQSNPCIADDIDDKYRLTKFYWKAERRSQFCRATYPYVDDYRAPIIHFFRSNTKLSNAATYYANWSNRYTLDVTYRWRRDETQADQDQGKQQELALFYELEAIVRGLRKKFEDALDTTDEAESGAAAFESISDDLLAAIDDFQGKISWLEAWFREVAAHQDEVQTLGESVTAGSGSDISQEDHESMVEQFARIGKLDELLTLLEEILELVKIGPPHMYIMTQSRPDSKGNEPWVYDRAQAEELFVLMAKASRDRHPIIFQPVYTNQLNQRRTTFAQSIVYNANGRNVEEGNDSKTHQPDFGWDTLNWTPPVRAPEWGDHKPSQKSQAPLALFQAGRKVGRSGEVQLNWQVKLVPLTESNITRFDDEQLRRLDSNLITH